MELGNSNHVVETMNRIDIGLANLQQDYSFQ